MFKNTSRKYQEASKGIFMSSVGGLANVLAVAATLLTAPLLYGNTVDWVTDFTGQHYGYGFDPLICLIWGACCGLGIFFAARASLSTGLVMAGIAVAMRFL